MKQFQLIHVGSNNEKDKVRLADLLISHDVTALGCGQHIIVVDDKPEGVNISRKYHPTSVKKAMNIPKIKKQAERSKAHLLTFDDKAFSAMKKYFSKQYIFKKSTANTMTFKSKTQKAHFSINHNGKIKTSKDLLDVDLLVNIVRIEYGEKPFDPLNAVH